MLIVDLKIPIIRNCRKLLLIDDRLAIPRGPRHKPTQCLWWGERKQASPLWRPAPSDATALLNANASAKVLQIFDICSPVSIKPLRGTFDAPFCPCRAPSPYLSGIGCFIHRPAERQDNYRLAERCMRWHTTCSVTVTRRGTACKMCMRNLGKLVILFSCQGLLDNSDLRNEETDG